MKKVVVAAVLLSVSIAFTSCKGEKKATKKEEVKTEVKSEHKEEAHKEMASHDVYQCPMDCEKGKTYEKEGKCPVCEMDLKKVEKSKEGEKKEGDHQEGHDH